MVDLSPVLQPLLITCARGQVPCWAHPVNSVLSWLFQACEAELITPDLQGVETETWELKNSLTYCGVSWAFKTRKPKGLALRRQSAISHKVTKPPLRFWRLNAPRTRHQKSQTLPWHSASACHLIPLLLSWGKGQRWHRSTHHIQESGSLQWQSSHSQAE